MESSNHGVTLEIRNVVGRNEYGFIPFGLNAGRLMVGLVIEESGELLQATDEVLEKFFGRNVRTQIYKFFEKRFMLKRSDIPVSLEIFSEAIYTLFGPASKQIELKILETLRRRLGTQPKQENCRLISEFARIVEAPPTRASTFS